MSDLDSDIQALPTEIQNIIYNQVVKIREPKVRLSPLQTLDIQTVTKFSEIIQQINESSLPHNHLNWFENSLLFELNDQKSLYEGFSDGMYKAFNTKNDNEIISQIENEHNREESQIRTMKHYWKHLRPGQKNRLYQVYMNGLLEYPKKN